MPCTRPLRGYYKPGGGVTFNRALGCTDRPIEVACGGCLDCRLTKATHWAIRITHEAQMWPENSFLRLSYNDKHLPRDASVNVRDLQTFLKRLRKAKPHKTLRFFACGEYGEQRLRPHYHMILFNEAFYEDRTLLTRKRQRNGNTTSLYRSDTLDQLWAKGDCTIGDVTFDSARYVAKYALQKITGEFAEDHYTRTDRETGECFTVKPEFATMSRGGRSGTGGIGATWFKRFRGDVFPADEIVMNGRKFRPPRFYDNMLPEADLLRLKLKRKQKLNHHNEKETARKNQAHEKITKTKIKLQKQRD